MHEGLSWLEVKADFSKSKKKKRKTELNYQGMYVMLVNEKIFENNEYLGCCSSHFTRPKASVVSEVFISCGVTVINIMPHMIAC